MPGPPRRDRHRSRVDAFHPGLASSALHRPKGATTRRFSSCEREEGLRVPQRRRRNRIGTSTTANTPVADGLNRLWAVDFSVNPGGRF